MNMPYSRHNLEGREKLLQRFFEIVPGGVSWSILLGLTALSWFRPMWAIIFILAFDLYWLFFLFYTMTLLLASYLMLSAERQTDWLTRADQLSELLKQGSVSIEGSRRQGWRGRISARIHRRKVRMLIEDGAPTPALESIHHVVIVPILTEGREIIEPCIESLLAQDFPRERTIVVLALEERATAKVKEEAWELHREHDEDFLGFYLSPHPANMEGESPVKGANITYAARMAVQVLEQKSIPLEHVVVTCLDCDSVLHPHYLSCLTYHYMVCPQRDRASFQPIPVYHNNVWEAPPVACILDTGSSFFQMVEATDPDKLVSFSSHSISLSALDGAGYWATDMVSDDSAIFWKAFLHFQGDYRVVPLPITLSMDVVQSETFWKTFKSVYRQKRRWAWGIENFPIVMRGFLHSPGISRRDKCRHGFKMLYKHVAWSTWAFLLLAIGGLPGLIASGGYHSSVAYYLAPRVQAAIFRLASIGLVTTVILSILQLPKPPPNYPWRRRLRHIAAWLWLPIASTVLSALPALDAQTRLMLGKDLAFRVTDKKRTRTPKV